MMETIKAGTRRPTNVELRMRVSAAISDFLAASGSREGFASLSSSQVHLVVDDEYRAVIVKSLAAGSAPSRYAVPLGHLGLDPAAIELGGGVRDAVIDAAALAIVHALERPEWWVP